MAETTLVIVDDHPLFRQGVADVLSLEPGFRVIGQAADGAAALEMIRELRPDIAIVDINLPMVNGQQVTHQVVAEKLPTRVVLLTGYDDGEQAVYAAWAGAAAYCAKYIEPQNLVQIIRDVSQGKFIVGDKILTRAEFDAWLEQQMESVRHSYSQPGNLFHPLSEREMEVLACMVRGMSNKEIATTLSISHQTVKNHVTSILRKFCVEDRTQAVVHALKRGWVQLYNQQSQVRE